MYHRPLLQILPKCCFWNSRICFSHVRLKEKFLKNLEVIRNSNEAQKFCGILQNAKEVIQEPECLHPPVEVSLYKNELHAHSIICELKEFIHKDKSGYILIDTILKTLKNTSNETRQQLISLLFSIHTVNFFNQKSQSSKEYLKCFIDDVECFLKSADKNRNSYIDNSQGDLKMVQARLYSSSEKDVANLLYIVRSAIFDEGHHSEDHRAEIEALMSDAASLVSTRLLQLNSVSKSVIEMCLDARCCIRANDDCHSTLEWFILFGYCYFVLDEVPFYCMTKKERLLQYLKDTKSINNACDFIELLMSINEFNSDTESDEESLNIDLIMNRLKDIIISEKPEYNMKKFILMSLQIRTPHLKEISELISRFFLDVVKFDCGKQNSEEYLMHFIQEFERHIDLYDNDLEKSYSPLDRIFFALMYIRNSCTAHLLEAILCKYHLHFFDEEKKRIGFLMVEAVTPIEVYLCFQRLMSSESSLLSQRSALQYFKDFFDSFPVDEIPLKRFDKNRIDVCIQELDNSIEYMYKYAKSEDEKTEDDELSDLDDHDDLYKDAASSFPESHVWWAKCSKTLNKVKKL